MHLNKEKKNSYHPLTLEFKSQSLNFYWYLQKKNQYADLRTINIKLSPFIYPTSNSSNTEYNNLVWDLNSEYKWYKSCYILIILIRNTNEQSTILCFLYSFVFFISYLEYSFLILLTWHLFNWFLQSFPNYLLIILLNCKVFFFLF